jgi:ABC-type phosphate/phosphonate transport system permease subunit
MRIFVKLLRVISLLVLLGLFIYGLKLGDFAETRYNGSILCISCIGIE